MQALGIAQQSALRVEILDQTLILSRGDEVYRSEPLVRCEGWHSGDLLFVFERSVPSPTILISLIKVCDSKLDIVGFPQLDLRQGDHALAAIWIVENFQVKSGQSLWNQFAKSLLKLIDDLRQV